MRDIFSEIFENEPSPMQAARRGMQPSLRKRFYTAADVVEEAGAFAVRLDGKPVRTPLRRSLAAPARGIADTIAAEWDAQKDVIDPASMPLTRLANSVIDTVADNVAPVRDEIVKYFGSDMVCYRAGEPEQLVKLQSQFWDPLIVFARDDLGVSLVLAEGIVHRKQSDEAIAAAARAIPQSKSQTDIWALGALSSVTTLTGSALIALALAAGKLSNDEAWAAAHVDENFQMSQWGQDTMAIERRAARHLEFEAAARVIALTRPGPS